MNYVYNAQVAQLANCLSHTKLFSALCLTCFVVYVAEFFDTSLSYACCRNSLVNCVMGYINVLAVVAGCCLRRLGAKRSATNKGKWGWGGYLRFAHATRTRLSTQVGRPPRPQARTYRSTTHTLACAQHVAARAMVAPGHASPSKDFLPFYSGQELDASPEEASLVWQDA